MSHYTKEQEKEIKDLISQSETINYSQIAKTFLSKHPGKSLNTVTVKVSRIAKGMKLNKKLPTVKRVSVKPQALKVENNFITLSKASQFKLQLTKGISFDGVANRIEMHDDHFRIYLNQQ